MQITPEIDAFLEGIQQKDGPEMHDTCATVIEGLSVGCIFHFFWVLIRAWELLNYEINHGFVALAGQLFDERED